MMMVMIDGGAGIEEACGVEYVEGLGNMLWRE
jgi:hypothetical protein